MEPKIVLKGVLRRWTEICSEGGKSSYRLMKPFPYVEGGQKLCLVKIVDLDDGDGVEVTAEDMTDEDVRSYYDEIASPKIEWSGQSWFYVRSEPEIGVHIYAPSEEVRDKLVKKLN